MTTTQHSVVTDIATETLRSDIVNVKRREVKRCAQAISDPRQSFALCHYRASACADLNSLARSLDALTGDDVMRMADAWLYVARTHTDPDVCGYTATIGGQLVVWATRCGDIGEPLHTEEGEDEDEPLYVPEVVPARPVPVPA